MREKVVRMEVGESVESDHHPLIVSVEGEGRRGGKEERTKEKEGVGNRQREVGKG